MGANSSITLTGGAETDAGWAGPSKVYPILIYLILKSERREEMLGPDVFAMSYQNPIV